MYHNFGKILLKAYNENYAIPAFNVDNYEMMKAVVQGAENLHSPVILMFTTSAIKYYGLKNLIDIGNNIQKTASVPVILHLDHQPDLEICKQAIDYGISSVMYDGSHLLLDENIKNCQTLISYAHNKNIIFEAELGQIGGTEDWKQNQQILYTSIQDVVKFCNECSVDWLAVSIGTAHGLYSSIPKIDFNLLKDINALNNQILVLHGGSGLPSEDIQRCILNGVGKVNFGTELKHAFGKGCLDYLTSCDNQLTDVRKMLLVGMKWVSELTMEKIKICMSEGKA